MAINVVYFISCFKGMNTGVGGHYHSFKTTVYALTSVVNPEIYVIGDLEPKAFLDFELPYKLISIWELRKLKNKLIDIKTVIHCFDVPSQAFINLFVKHSCILTICGGKNPALLPHSYCYILFSKENYEYIKSIKKLAKSELHLIPNRVDFSSITQNQINISDVFIKDYADSVKIMRISRITKYYEKSILHSVNLVKKLNEKGINAVLIIIGKIEDNSLYEHLAKQENVLVLKEEKNYKNPKKYLNAADIIIGTGRSFMEAVAFEKILLAPAENTNIPVLITGSNINHFLNYNFSERTKVDLSDDEIFEQIVDVIENNDFAKKNISDIKTFGINNFEIKSVLENYKRIYTKFTIKKNPSIEFLNSFKIILRIYIIRKIKLKYEQIFN